MTERTPGPVPSPGDVAPSVRTLDRPPGERHRRPDPGPDPGRRPKLLRGLLLGLVAVAAVAVAWGLLVAVLDIDLGLLAVAIVGGWAVGLVVSYAAWGAAAHPPSTHVRGLAAVLGAAAWLGGTFVAYLVSLAILPGSVLDFGERIAAQPFADWLLPQIGVVDILAVALLAFVAWRSAR